MKGKFRKRSSAVWCPKPRTIPDYKQMNTTEYIKMHKALQLLDPRARELQEQAWLERNVPRVTRKFTGWTNMTSCNGCGCLEEFDLDNNGVFCTWPEESGN